MLSLKHRIFPSFAAVPRKVAPLFPSLKGDQGDWQGYKDRPEPIKHRHEITTPKMPFSANEDTEPQEKDGWVRMSPREGYYAGWKKGESFVSFDKFSWNGRNWSCYNGRFNYVLAEDGWDSHKSWPSLKLAIAKAQK